MSATPVYTQSQLNAHRAAQERARRRNEAARRNGIGKTATPAGDAEKTKERATRPEWRCRPIYFNAHVLAFDPFRNARYRKEWFLIDGMASEYGLTYADVASKQKSSDKVFARHEIWMKLREMGFTLERIAYLFGYHHTSVMHGIQAAKARYGDANALAYAKRHDDVKRAQYVRRKERKGNGSNS